MTCQCQIVLQDHASTDKTLSMQCSMTHQWQIECPLITDNTQNCHPLPKATDQLSLRRCSPWRMADNGLQHAAHVFRILWATWLTVPTSAMSCECRWHWHCMHAVFSVLLTQCCHCRWHFAIVNDANAPLCHSALTKLSGIAVDTVVVDIVVVDSWHGHVMVTRALRAHVSWSCSLRTSHCCWQSLGHWQWHHVNRQFHLYSLMASIQMTDTRKGSRGTFWSLLVASSMTLTLSIKNHRLAHARPDIRLSMKSDAWWC